MNVASLEDRVRIDAMAWLTVRTNDGQDAIRSNDLLDFTVNGEPFRLMDPQRGIRSPRGFAARALDPHGLHAAQSGCAL
ncbi:MAG: hypothetical protein M3O28_03995 [Actinomycetota bacterium]|nr:hypothetical protein [Actinomycetota bacterium]